MTTPATPPPEAITAATQALNNLEDVANRGYNTPDAIVRLVLEAAWPHLAAAAAEQLAAWLEGPQATAVTANTIRAQVEREIAGAVAAERERCAQHLEVLAANYPSDLFRSDGTSRDAISGTAMRHALYTAAGLLRQEGGGT